MKALIFKIAIGFYFSIGMLHADALSEGLGAYEKGNYMASSLFFEEACDNNVMEACYNLALMYDEGVGVYKDDQKAMMLLTKACEGGFVDGCYNLGIMYEKGEGVTQDTIKAFTLYYQACEKGHTRGCYSTALM